MYSMARRFAAIFVLIVCGAGVLTAQIPPGKIEVDPRVEELIRSDRDQIVLTGGRLSGQQEGCKASPRGFLRATGAAGDLWYLSQHAAGCNLEGSLDLFAGVTSFDPAYLVGSTLFDAGWDPQTGEVYAVGEVYLAWFANEQEVSGTGTVVLHFFSDGALARDAYRGPVPHGAPTGGGCRMICRPAGKITDDRGGRALTLDRLGVLVTGWGTNALTGDREVEVIRFAGDPLVSVWEAQVGTATDDEGRAVIASDGEVFVLGHSGGDRDVFLSRILEGGIPAEQVIFSGPSDDEGRELAFDSEGRLLASGIMSERLVLGAFALVSAGQDEREWSAVIDRSLQPISAVLEEPLPPVEPPNNLPSELPENLPKEPPSRPFRSVGPIDRWQEPALPSGPVRVGTSANSSGEVDNHPAVPVAYEVVTGSKARGDLKTIAYSDDRYLRIKTEGTNRIELKVTFDPDPTPEPIPLYLKEVTAELHSDYCYKATVLVNGVASQDFLVAGQRDLCPSEEPILRVPVSKEMSEALGFDGQQVLVSDQRIVVVLRLDFEGDASGWNGYASEQDSSVDEVGADVEY